jgi:uncharacterized membrane protein YdjX (TVP38/TMEM64 family)
MRIQSAFPVFVKIVEITLKTCGFVMLALGLMTAPALASSDFTPQNFLRDALTQIEGLGAVGAIAFIALYIVATVAFLPGSILTLGAGVVFGVVQGSIYVFIGATLGATLAFLIGRYVARDWVAKKIAGSQKFKAIDHALGKAGFKIILLTRLSPVFPFNLLNYVLGATQVSLRDYFFGCIGMIPGTIMYVYIGSLAYDLTLIGSANQPTNPEAQWAIRLMGFVATVAVTLYGTRVAQKALAESVTPEVIPDQN